MDRKQTIVIWPAVNGFILSKNKTSDAMDVNDLMVFSNLDDLIKFLTDHFKKED